MIPKNGHRFSDQIMRQKKSRVMTGTKFDGGVPRSKKA